MYNSQKKNGLIVPRSLPKKQSLILMDRELHDINNDVNSR